MISGTLFAILLPSVKIIETIFGCYEIQNDLRICDFNLIDKRLFQKKIIELYVAL